MRACQLNHPSWFADDPKKEIVLPLMFSKSRYRSVNKPSTNIAIHAEYSYSVCIVYQLHSQHIWHVYFWRSKDNRPMYPCFLPKYPDLDGVA